MEVVKLTQEHSILVQKMYENVRLFVNNDPSPALRKAYADNFCYTFLSDLKSYHAYGAIQDGELSCAIGFYESIDDAAWYWVQLLSSGNVELIRATLDKVIEHNEARGRLKFYSMFPENFARVSRRLVFSKQNAERYDSFDEFYVDSKARCIFTLPWQALYERVLHPKKTIVRCTFLKQQHRFRLINASGAY